MLVEIGSFDSSIHIDNPSRPGPLRLDTLHLRGVDHMSTDDIFGYFRGHRATGVEWIDDSTCKFSSL